MIIVYGCETLEKGSTEEINRAYILFHAGGPQRAELHTMEAQESHRIHLFTLNLASKLFCRAKPFGDLSISTSGVLPWTFLSS
jgi:hypothetical protein